MNEYSPETTYIYLQLQEKKLTYRISLSKFFVLVSAGLPLPFAAAPCCQPAPKVRSCEKPKQENRFFLKTHSQKYPGFKSYISFRHGP